MWFSKSLATVKDHRFAYVFVMLSLILSTPGKLKSLLDRGGGGGGGGGMEPATFGLLVRKTRNKKFKIDLLVCTLEKDNTFKQHTAK
jgi:hypothetical protein